MSKTKFYLAALILVTGISSFGASIDHIQNYTPEYGANPAQQGAINRNTSVYFNPAGLMRLEDGTYLRAGIQYAYGKETMTYKGKEYSADLGAPVPNLALYTKNKERTWFWTFGGLGGGGDLKYDDGVAGIGVLEDVINMDLGIAKVRAKDLGSSAEGSNMYIQSTLGRAWDINDKVSVSLAGRVVRGSRLLKGHLNAELNTTVFGKENSLPIEAEIDSERTAWGFGGQFGLNYAATERLNIGMRYDTTVRMNFKADADEKKASLLGKELGFSDFFPEYADGRKVRRDLPALLALGASYKMTDSWTTFVGGNYYFNESAKIDKKANPNHDIEYDNGWEVSLGSEYWLNKKWAWMIGANYSDTGAHKDTFSDVEYALDSFMAGTGVKYRPDESMEWIVSYNHYWYDSAKGNFTEKYPGKALENQNYKKKISSVGLGFTKKI
ncbi:outer membrane protein transport protein [Cetobacterium sp. 2A]|uniref:OmpP1/FadL family transporter n=1 Tax=Cetobacterium sp. 2A TaxID=2754723 RepID=UPI00163B884C|nr:outer membrane protein transport protein [Cetobacterium sp. 2A]MBC2855794.1 outer membrane protein transport protein [Cetobacterium sp. 2A]MBC2857215.1 outer membrane protein transport protein [Cetobacterium sp. 2A]MBC2857227.1 outer membrane protein transport protein [Cetobacterium sp. 2A]MBC2857233.1 outer membrane protein transport protein [Cetobacterium sp. 2A]